MKKFDVPTLLLVSYLIRLQILGATIGDAITVSALVSLVGFIYLINSKKEPDVNAEVKAQLDALQKELNETKSKVNAIQLGTQLRGKL